MTKVFQGVPAEGAFALCAAGEMAAAKAEVRRVAIVVADSAADYRNNAALLKKGGRRKAGTSFH